MLTRHDTPASARAPAPPAPVEPLAGILQTYLAYHLHGDPLTARLQEITAPGLILHGTADTEVPFGEAEHLHTSLPTSWLIAFAGGSHSLPVTHAEPYRHAIIDFLQTLGLAPSRGSAGPA
jgi:pimeloyl-ACP methyl ester carboxylesterase